MKQQKGETTILRNNETAKQWKADAKVRNGDAKQRKYETTKVRNYEWAMRKIESESAIWPYPYTITSIMWFKVENRDEVN